MSKLVIRRTAVAAVVTAAGALYATGVQAVSFSLPWGEDGIESVLNTTITAGASLRMQDRHTDYLGKANVNPLVCSGVNQSCQGLFRDQGHPAAALAAQRGQFSPNFDDGNWNYDKGDLTSGIAKITQDLTLTYGDFGIFAKGLYFYDWVNADFDEFHPNEINRANKASVGEEDSAGVRKYGPGAPVRRPRNNGDLLSQTGTELQLLDSYFFGSISLTEDMPLSFKVGRQAINWGESLLLALNSVNQANPVNANNFYRVGFQVEEVFTPVGMISASFEPFYGATVEAFYEYEWLPVEAPAPGTMLQLSDVIGTNNAADPVYVQFGGGAEDPQAVGYPLATPLSGVTNSTTSFERLPDLEPDDGGQYGVSLKYYAEDLNNGTEFGLYYMNYHSRLPIASFYASAASCARREANELGIDAYDPISFLATCPDLPILHEQSGDTQLAASNAVPLDSIKLQVEYPEDIQLFGVSFNTTAFGWSFQGEVAYRPNSPLQVDAEDLTFAALGPTLSRCHDEALLRNVIPSAELNGALGQANAIFGALNQATGGIIGIPDVLPAGVGCAGTTSGVGSYVDNGYDTPNQVLGGEAVYGPSDYVTDANGTQGGFRDTFDLGIGHAPGSARAFPAFVTAYRGTEVGENAACSQQYIYNGATQQTTGYGSVNRDVIATDQGALTANPNFIPYTPSNPCYIRGYEEMQVYQFNLGGTQVLGATDNPIGADQIQFVFETGATWVPDLPSLDLLQLEAAGTYAHASAGADGSGGAWTTERQQRLACSYDPVTHAPRQSCSYGVDGLRFNPHQANLDLYPDPFSWGYVLIAIIKYESVFPGISFAPQIIWKHDVNGTAPGPGENFIAGRKTADIQWETRYKSNFAFYLGYTWYTGAGDANIYRDKDMARAFVKAQF